MTHLTIQKVPTEESTKVSNGFMEADATEETPLNTSNGMLKYDDNEYDMDNFLNETSKYTISREDSSISQDEIWFE